MKTLSTILLSLAAATTFAAPFSKPATTHTPVGQQAIIEATCQLDKETKAQMRDFFNQQFGQQKAKQFNSLTMKKAQADYVNIHFECDKLGNSAYFSGTKDWFFNFRDDSYGVELDLVNLENPKCFTGTYTADDCLLNYCSFWNYEEGWAAGFTDINVTCKGLNDDYDPTLGCEVTGEGTLDNGLTVSFHLLDPGPLMPTETVEVKAEVVDYGFYSAENNGYSFFKLQDPETGLGAEIAYYGMMGNYKDGKIFAEVTEGEAVYNYVSGTLDVDMDSEANVVLHAELVCDNAVKYVFDAAAPFQVEGQATIEAHNLYIEDYYGVLFFLTGSTEEYPSIEVATYTNPYVAGDMTNDFRVTMYDQSYTMISAMAVLSATISMDENDKPVVDAKFIGTDAKEYTLHMDLVQGDITDEIDLNIDGVELQDLTATAGAFQIYYQEGGVNLSVVYDAPAMVSGHYDTISETYASYCAVIYNNASYPMFWCETDLQINEDGTFSVSGSCQAGTIKFNFSGVGELPMPEGDSYDDPDNDLELSFTREEFDEYEINTTTGDVFLSAINADNKYVALQFVIGSEFEAGEYPINSTFAAGTCVPGSIDYYQGGVYPSFAGDLVNGYLNVPLWLITSGTATVAFDAEGMPSVEVNASNTWGRHAHIVINPIEDAPVAIENVAASTVKAGKFMEGNSIVIRTETREFNAMGQAK